MTPSFKKASMKWHNGTGALLCSGCDKVIATGFEHEDREHYCKRCRWRVRPVKAVCRIVYEIWPFVCVPVALDILDVIPDELPVWRIALGVTLLWLAVDAIISRASR